MWGSGVRVWSSGVRVWGSGVRVWGSGVEWDSIVESVSLVKDWTIYPGSP